MKRIHLIFFIIGAILAIVLSRFLSPNPLSDVTINNLELNNRQFIFENGRIRSADSQKVTSQEEQQIKRLVYFYLLTIEDPLFTSPDLDTSGLIKVVNQLKLVEDKFTADFPDYPHLFPINFLSSIPDVKNAEKSFLQKPSEGTAQNLLSAYNNTAQKYQEDSSAFIKTVYEHETEIPESSMVYLNAASSKPILLSDLKLLEKNAQALVDEIDKRSSCLTTGASCYRPALSFTKPTNTQMPQPSIDLLDQKILFVGLTDEEKKTIKGPYYATNRCLNRDTELPFYLYSKENRYLPSKNIPLLEIKLASDNYFRKVSRTGMDQGFPEGYERIWQRETRNYLCPDLGYQANLATMDYFLQLFKQKPLITNNPAKKLEADLLNNQQPSYEQVTQLSFWYAYLYRTSNDPIIKQELLTRFLILDRSLNSLPEILEKSVNEWLGILSLNSRIHFIEETQTMLTGLYLPRSAWSFMYLTFSSSVWRLQESLQLSEDRQVTGDLSTLPYWNYQQMKSYYGDEDINKIQELSVENTRNY